jgi:hypothetical protein
LVHESTIKGHLSTQSSVELLYSGEVIFTIFSIRVLFDVAPTDLLRTLALETCMEVVLVVLDMKHLT